MSASLSVFSACGRNADNALPAEADIQPAEWRPFAAVL